jgi:hypothetical protein
VAQHKIRRDEDAVPRPPPAGAVAVAGSGGAAWAVAAGPAGARGRRPGGGPRGREQRGAPRGAQAPAEAAAAAVAAAVPGRARPAPREEGGAAARDGHQLGEALLRRRAAGGRAGALQQEDGTIFVLVPISLYWHSYQLLLPSKACIFFSVYVVLIKRIAIRGFILILNMREQLDLSVNSVLTKS